MATLKDLQPPGKKKPNSPGNKGLNDFAKYSGMAFQMVAIILVSTWGGVQLDKLVKLHTPVFTIVLSLLGVFAALYSVLKDFLK